jgi:hypothetical protein
MDETTRELIAGLCVRAGTLMEDCSADLVSVLPSDAIVIDDRIALIDWAGQDLIALAAAARVLHRLSRSGGSEGRP